MSLDSENYSIPENYGNVTVFVTRQGDMSSSFVLQLEVTGITAEPELDFEPTISVIQFLANEVEKEIVVLITDDQLPEQDEVFALCLSYAGPDAITILLPKANVTILNDDSEYPRTLILPSSLFVANILF